MEFLELIRLHTNSLVAPSDKNLFYESLAQIFEKTGNHSVSQAMTKRLRCKVGAL